MRLDADTAVPYLVQRGLLAPGAPAVVRPLDGGVSCSVFAVDGGGRSVVVKQALPRLRVAQTWLADPARAGTEAAALELLQQLTPDAVPQLLDSDPDNHALVVSCAPPDWGPWKADLLRSRVSAQVAERLGTLLARWHTGTTVVSALDPRFRDPTAFTELRVSPFHREVQRRHPGVADLVDDVVGSMLLRRLCLVHGDFSPKNVLVGDGGVWVVDLEVAHVGDPTFDLAFLLTHLLLKAVHLPDCGHALQECAQGFLESYRSEVVPPLLDREDRLLRQVGCLLLARVDGKSPAGYLTEDGQAEVRRLGLGLLRGDAASVDDAFLAARVTAR